MNFQVPPDNLLTSQSWQISSVQNSPGINLTFQPKGNHQEHDNLVLVFIDFFQIFGVFSGTIQMLDRTYIIEDSWGVVEHQYAKW